MRQDADLAFLLQYENIAWYEDGAVRILDRRIFPAKKEFVTCRSFDEVAQALKDMVTQSAGPFSAAPMGMALAAYESRNLDKTKRMDFLKKAAFAISHARPTTVKRMTALTDACLAEAERAMEAGEDVPEALKQLTIKMNDERYAKIGRIAGHLVDKIPDDGTVMTYCFAETIIGMMLRECRNRGKEIRLVCPETRPYFQGSRLTASCIKDMGFDVTVISDGMAASAIQNKKIDLFTTAADAICCDGHVINKVGTFNTAIVADYFGVPYYVTGSPDPGHPTADTVEIEMRDGERVLYAMQERTAAEGVKGYYPAFDITPPELVTGVVTDIGIYPPKELNRYFADLGGEKGKMCV